MSQANEKVHETLNGVDIKNQINIIVDQLQIQEDAREVVNGIIKEMKDTYGLPPSVIRSAANIIHKHNKEEIEEKNEQVEELLTFCQ